MIVETLIIHKLGAMAAAKVACTTAAKAAAAKGLAAPVCAMPAQMPTATLVKWCTVQFLATAGILSFFAFSQSDAKST